MKKIQVLLTVTSTVVAVGFGAYVYYQNLKKDEIGPTITAESSELVMSIADGNDKILEGMKAIDDKDGDVSDTLLVESIAMAESGKCTVVYAAYDRSCNVSRAARKLDYTDYESPKFTIAQPLRFQVGTFDALQQAVGAVDCIDGDISDKIRIRTDDASAYSNAGIYDYELEVTNSLGETVLLPISVEYYTNSHENKLYRPEVVLTEYLTYLKAGESFEPAQYMEYIRRGDQVYAIDENSKTMTLLDDKDGDNVELPFIEKEGKVADGIVNGKAVRVTGTVDTGTPGVYTISYTCKTADGYSGTTQLTVVVQ